jgi:signal transduction histidine kinase
MTPEGYAFLGLTAIVGVLLGVVAFAFMRLVSGARDARKNLRETGRAETVMLSAALQEAVGKLKAQEQATAARAAASEQLSSEIVESLTAGLLVVERNGAIDIFNAAGRRMLGMSDTALGTDYRETLAAVPPLVALIEECFATGQPILRRPMEIPNPDRPLHFGVTVSLLGDLPAPRGVICLFTDLTAIVELEEQLRLKEALARLGELTAGIAHEFRNGLATIHGYSRLIDPASLPESYRPYVEGIRQETEALGKVVTNFLNFARPEQVSFSRVDLGAVARRAADDLRHELPAGTSLTVDGTYGDVQGDEVLLRQVFGNLVRNAVQACEGAGVVPIVTVHGDIDREPLRCRVVVDDNGPGIPEAARERIFQPFFTTRSGGSGLGLAIVQKIVVMHNGRVTADTGSRGGARLQLTLPLA